MRRLGKAVTEAVAEEYGEKEFLQRISNPFFFQSLGCALGFDWHSSGVTTTVCGALKEGLKESDCGIKVLGGKGGASRKTPQEINEEGQRLGFGEQQINKLIYSSKMSAKVDSALVQDGYQLYQHSFFLSREGEWAVVQQGMNEENRMARRYHWLGMEVKNFVVEPQKAVCCNEKGGMVLNMVAREGEEARRAGVDLVKEGPEKLQKYSELRMPKGHLINKRNYAALNNAQEFNPKNYEELVALQGIGPKTVRALALLSELVYGTELSWRDPAKYCFAHGGKDGTPFPVLRAEMDESTRFLEEAIEQTKLGREEKKAVLKRLKEFVE
jgi:hypothetical protein